MSSNCLISGRIFAPMRIDIGAVFRLSPARIAGRLRGLAPFLEETRNENLFRKAGGGGEEVGADRRGEPRRRAPRHHRRH